MKFKIIHYMVYIFHINRGLIYLVLPRGSNSNVAALKYNISVNGT